MSNTREPKHSPFSPVGDPSTGHGQIPAQLQTALQQVRRDARELLEVGRVVAPEYLQGTAPFQDQVHVRSLIFDFLSHYALMLLEWAERAEAMTAEWSRLSSAEREQRALETIRRDFGLLPDPGASHDA